MILPEREERKIGGLPGRKTVEAIYEHHVLTNPRLREKVAVGRLTLEEAIAIEGREMSEESSSVYLVDSGTTKDGLLVFKVGYTTNPKGRLSSFRTTWPDAQIVKVWPGGLELEQAIHRVLKGKFTSRKELYFVPAVDEILTVLEETVLSGGEQDGLTD